jgi:hypothetical protein
VTCRTLLRTLPVAAALALASAANAFSPLLASVSVKTYRSAVADARRGKALQATAVLDGLLMRRQVKIAVDPSGAPASRENEYLAGVQEAMDSWESALGESPFVMAAAGQKPDITVRFVQKISKGGEVQGAIEAKRRFFWTNGVPGYDISGGIQIKTTAYNHTLSGVEAGRVMAHELGHLLGLDDHYDSRGIMGAFRLGEGRVRPNDAEVEAVTEFRDELRSALRLASTR